MKYLTFSFLYTASFLPQNVFAADALDTTAIPGDIVTCKKGGECDFCDFMDMVTNINLWVLGIALLIGVILAIYAGYRITSSRGDVSIVTEARKMIGNVAIGIIIIVLATSMVDIVVKTATGGEFGWWNPPSNEKCGKQDQDGEDNVTPLSESLNPNNPGLQVADPVAPPTNVPENDYGGGGGGGGTNGSNSPADNAIFGPQ